MASIRSWVSFEGVTETAVPGQTRTSPPLDNCSTAVSVLAVRDDPAATRLPANIMTPSPPVTGTIAGAADGPAGGFNGDLLVAVFGSSPSFKRTISRFPASSQV